jgi:integrase
MATKLENGQWRTQVLISEPGAPRKYKSFYGLSEDEADFKALEYKLGKKKSDDKSLMTIAQAVDAYIELRRPVLSPSTIRGYVAIQRNYISDTIANKKIADVEYLMIQSEANRLSAEFSVKTAKNTIGLITAAIKVYRPDFAMREISYPKKKKKAYATPDGNGLAEIFRVTQGTNAEVPVLLASWLSLRASEVVGLKWEDIHEDYLNIDTAIVLGESGAVEKGTKTDGSERKIPLPPFIREKLLALPRTGKHVFEGVSASAISKRFHKVLLKNNLPLCRFHDLRHANASIMLMLGVPDKYAMERGGWTTTSVLKGVYQQTFTSEQKAVAERIDNYFLGLMQQ